MYIQLQHSYFEDGTLTGTHQSGFYSCINEARNSLFTLISDFKIFPERISFRETLNWYRDDQDLYEILYKTDKEKIDFLKNYTFDKNKMISCATGTDYRTLDINKIKILNDVYFLPSERVEKRVKELEHKYNIDYNNILAVLHRGTDKWKEAILSPFEQWIQHIEEKNDKGYRILIQTDDIVYKENFLKELSSNFIFEEMIQDKDHVKPTSNKIQWCIDYESIMRIISKCNKIITHAGNSGQIPILYRGNLNNVSQCYCDGTFITF